MFEKELSIAQWRSILDEVTEAGCLNLLITGGEPLIRKDFNEIYTHAKKKGLLVSVFSNGTLLTQDHVDLFKDLPPKVVEISLYGATVQTYETIAGVKGSYQRCIDGIERLLNAGIHVKLKTILMTPNQHEFEQIKTMAEDYGVDFRFDPALFPRFSGDQYPTELRVTPEYALSKELANREIYEKWCDHYQHYRDIVGGMTTSYICGAGVNSFHIDAYGKLHPCLMGSPYPHDILGGGFAEGWGDIISRIRFRQAGPENNCTKCEKQSLCGYCPAFFRLETGSEEIRSEYICKIGSLRFEAITRHSA